MDLKQNYSLESVRDTIEWLQEINRDAVSRMDQLAKVKAHLVGALALIDPLTTRPGFESRLYTSIQTSMRDLGRERDLLRDNIDKNDDRLRDLYGIEADLETDKAERENALRHPLTDREADFAV
jgi:hypothetical protein